MKEIINHLSSNGLSTALESNMVAFWSAYGRGSDHLLHTKTNIVWFYSGLQIPIFNGVIFAKFDLNETDATIKHLQSLIDKKGAPAIWWLGPSSTPEKLGPYLEQQGLISTGESPGMAIELTRITSTPNTMKDFVVKKVNNMEMLELWAHTAAIGSDFPDEAEELAKLEVSLSDSQYKVQHRYIGFLNDIPVSTSAMVLDSGVAGIYAVATIPNARRIGIGEIMTAVPLQQARQNGYKVGILQSSAMGYSLYLKIGFQDVCKFRLYLQSTSKL